MMLLSVLRTTAAASRRSQQIRGLSSTLNVLNPLGKDSTIENNTLSEANRAAKTLTRFWTSVGIEENDTHYEIKLDEKTIRTPLGYKLAIPKDRAVLAHLLQHEWACLTTSTIKTHSLPLTSLASRVVDLEQSNGNNESEQIAKVGKKADIVEDLLRYLDTDTLLVFSPAKEYEGTLRKAQEEKYRPIIKEIEEYLDVKLEYLDSDLHGLRGIKQTEDTRNKTREFLLNLNYWDLVALEKVTLSAKSLICGILVLKAKSLIDPKAEARSLEEIAEACTLEVIYQTDRWGEVEDTHDVDYQDIRRNIASSAILAFQELKAEN